MSYADLSVEESNIHGLFFPWKAAASQNSSSENCVVDLFSFSSTTRTHMVQLVHSALSGRGQYCLLFFVKLGTSWIFPCIILIISDILF